MIATFHSLFAPIIFSKNKFFDSVDNIRVDSIWIESFAIICNLSNGIYSAVKCWESSYKHVDLWSLGYFQTKWIYSAIIHLVWIIWIIQQQCRPLSQLWWLQGPPERKQFNIFVQQIRVLSLAGNDLQF